MQGKWRSPDHSRFTAGGRGFLVLLNLPQRFTEGNTALITFLHHPAHVAHATAVAMAVCGFFLLLLADHTLGGEQHGGD